MQFRDLVFITVAEQLSFSKAAEALFISQPAITKHIKQMESQLNVSLFDRRGSKIYLTEAGKVVYDKLKEIHHLYQEMEYAIGALNNEHIGELRIGASSTIAQYILPRFLAYFYQRYPKVHLNLFNGNSAQMEQMLQNQDIDVALVENKTKASNLKYQTFCTDRIVAVTRYGNVMGNAGKMSLAQLQKLPLVVREFGSGTLQILEDSLKSQGLQAKDLKIVVHLGSTEAIKNFLPQSDAFAFVSDRSIENELALKQLRIVEVDKLDITRELRCVMRQGYESSMAQQFISALTKYNF